MTSELFGLFGTGLLETLYMVIVSTLLAYIIGIPMGIILNVTSSHGIRPNRAVNVILGVIVNILRSVPFIILLLALIPFTRACLLYTSRCV